MRAADWQAYKPRHAAAETRGKHVAYERGHFEGLLHLTGLQHLELWTCRIPACLSQLTMLTALTVRQPQGDDTAASLDEQGRPTRLHGQSVVHPANGLAQLPAARATVLQGCFVQVDDVPKPGHHGL